MTNEEFIQKVREIRPAYMKACEDYLDALERLDLETALNHSMTAPRLMGTEMMAYIMNGLNKIDMTDLEEEYERVTDELQRAYDASGL